MRGGRQLAKPDVARPLDGRVRAHQSARSIHCELMKRPPFCAYSLNTPTVLYPNFECSRTDASFGSAMPTTARCRPWFVSSANRRVYSADPMPLRAVLGVT